MSNFFLLLCAVVCPLSLASTKFFCDFSDNTDISESYAEWNCTDGVPMSNPCDWRGVTCLNSSVDNVIEIILTGLDIEGTIPNSINSLSALTNLDISENQLFHNIDQPINMTALLSITLNDNNLYSGPFLEFVNMKNLEVLDLSDNSLGYIPGGLLQMTSLEYLDLSGNFIEGVIPSAIGDLSKLETLDLEDNFLFSTLPSSLWTLTNLKSLQLSSNQLSSSIPESVGNLVKMDTLQIRNNCLAGHIPSSLGSLHKLIYVGLEQNMLSQQIPTQIGSLSNLVFLSIADNRMTGEVPESLCDISTLVYFDGSGNLFDCFASCLFIPHLELDFNITQHCPGLQDIAMCDLESAFGMSEIVNSMSITGDTVAYGTEHPVHVDSEPQHFEFNAQIGDATSYDVRFDPLMGSQKECNSTVTFCINRNCFGLSKADYPGLFFGNPALHVDSSSFIVYYTVSCERFAAVDPYGFQMYVTPLYRGTGWSCSLDSDGNVHAVGLCEPDTPWTGVTCLYDTAVVELDLKTFGISGTIPTTLSYLSSATTITLSFNSISGTIPGLFLEMESLEYLDISNNYLTGTLPVSFSDNESIADSSLFKVFLDQNMLTGSLPSILTRIDGLFQLKLDGNDFSGKLHSDFCQENGTVITLSQNPRLCYSECWTESHPTDIADKNICIPAAKKSIWISNAMISVYSVVGVVFLVLLCGGLWMKWRMSKVHPDGKEKMRRLEHLPIHKALVCNLPRSHLLQAIKQGRATAKERDYDGQTAIDIIISSVNPPVHVTSDILVELVMDSLPMDVETGRPIEDPAMHIWAWPKLVQCSHRLCTETVEAIVEMHKKHVTLLTDAEDAAGRRSIDIASPECKFIMTKALYLYERFELFPGPPEHISLTCVVRFAYDHGNPDKRRPRPSSVGTNRLAVAGVEKSVRGESSRRVALKFMKHRDQFFCELETRKMGNFDEDVVVNVKMDLNGDTDEKFRADAALKGYSQYPYCLVMDAADGNLQRKVAQQHIAGKDWDKIRYIVLNLVNGLRHMHMRGYVHGDLKPMNVLPVNDTMKLTDFDAAASLQAGSYVGAKYSSAYVPPELLWCNPSGHIVVRTFQREAGGKPVGVGELPYSLVQATVGHDIWSLGAITYLLCTGNPIFLSNVETDNIADQEDLAKLMEWSPETKMKKLSNITDRYARNLVSMMLTKDPTKRPDCDHVLQHPFLTGKAPIRMDGEEPTYDLFLSYRVASDADIVEVLYDTLTERGFKVWFDKKCLPPGLEWERGFCRGLLDSRCFVCIMSREAVNSRHDMSRNVNMLQPNSRCDNVLLEWRLALELGDRGLLRGIYPVMVGDKLPRDDLVFYGDYFADGCHPSHAENIVLLNVESKLREHLEREGLGLPVVDELGVKDILARITRNQGGFLRGEFSTGIANIVASITDMVENSKK